MFFLVFVQCAYAAESSESFVVRNYDRYIRVVAPEKFDPEINLLIENKTLTKLYGKVETKGGRAISHISIYPKGFKTIKLGLRRGEKAVFVPLSPSFQAVDLTFGKQPYEIPPQK